MNKLRFIILFGIIVLFTGCNNTSSHSTLKKNIKNIDNKNTVLENQSKTTSTSKNTSSNSSEKQQSNIVKNNNNIENQIENSLQSPVAICVNNENDGVLEKIKSIMSNELKFEKNEIDTFDVHKSVYEVNLGNLLKNQDKQLLAVTPSHVVLFKSNNDLTEIEFIDNIDDLKINLNTLKIETNNNLILLQSKTAFDSSSYKYSIEWNGIKLNLKDVLEYDSIKEYYEKREKLIEYEDIDSLTELHMVSSNIELLSKYKKFYTQPKKILILANKKAGKYIEQENYIKASQILGYALNQYTLVWYSSPILKLSDNTLKNTIDSSHINNLLKENELIEVLNKYAASLYNIESFSDALKVSSLILSLDENNKDAIALKSLCEKSINKK